VTSPDSTSSLRLAVIGGDGIGPEVTDEALKVLEVAAPVKVEPTRYDLGAERYYATGEVLPDSVLGEIRGHDAILLGAVGGKPGDPRLPAGILERGQQPSGLVAAERHVAGLPRDRERPVHDVRQLGRGGHAGSLS
jgi:3-isopropylmalate dehydrogenase